MTSERVLSNKGYIVDVCFAFFCFPVISLTMCNWQSMNTKTALASFFTEDIKQLIDRPGLKYF